MAINSHDKQIAKTTPSTTKSICSKSSNLSVCRLMKIDYTADGSVTSNDCKYDESNKKKNASPYLKEDRIQLLSRITEKRLVRKKTTDIISSFPLAANIYKASSDEFKSLKSNSKKVKKSVLTLPNEPAPLPQACTVSDMNDSEYFNEKNDERKQKTKKRRQIPVPRKPCNKYRGIEVFDRDARYCSQLNIDLDSSSTDTINHFTGDVKKLTKKRQKNIQRNSSINANDVWAMLRNMNRFQFRPSPPLSQDSAESTKKRRTNKRRNNQMDAKFFETCRTEQFTYISSLVDKTPHNSQSSIDRITVIDKQDEYQDICEELKVVKNKIPVKEKGSLKKLKYLSKNKSNIRAKQSNAIVTDTICNNKRSRRSNTNRKLETNFSEGPQYNKQDDENKCMLLNVFPSNPHLVCPNKCLYCHNNVTDSTKENHEFNDHDHVMTLCGNSDSSNGDIIKNLSDMTDPNKFDKLSPSDSQCQINGITKVVLSKGQNIVLSKKAEFLKRKPRLVTTMPSGAVIPKLTQTEIKRRLAKIKFPVVILAKDEVCSTFQVTNYEPPQLAGLDEHIWPFMQNWLDMDFKKGFLNCNVTNKCVNKKFSQGMKGDYISEYDNDMKNCKISVNNNVNIKSKRKNSIAMKDKNTVQQAPKVKNVCTKAPNMKPIRQFKDRMLQFLHKKSTFGGKNNNSSTHEFAYVKEIPRRLVEVATNTERNLVYPIEYNDILCKKEGTLPPMKQPWGKGRWASDFIDNVIKKIKSGVYYNQDEKYCPKIHCITKDDWVQTEFFDKNDYCYNCNQKTNAMVAVKQNYDPLIPGFDDSISGLQIESVNKNQIAIKHCLTNIIVQFDVVLPSAINRMLQLEHSVSCIPVTVTESQTKIFKSKTTIVNAILPAELCSIFPKMMRKIIDTRLTLPKIVDKVDTCLSTIAEIRRYESRDSIKQLMPAQIHASPELRRLRQGEFTNKLSVVYPKNKLKNYYKEICSMTLTDFLPNLKRQTNQIYNYEIDPIALHIFGSYQSLALPENDICSKEIKQTCLKLQPYSLRDKQIVPTFQKIDFNNFAKAAINNQNSFVNLSMLNLCFYKNINYMAPNTKRNCLMESMDIKPFYNCYQESLNVSKDYVNIVNINLVTQKSVAEYTNSTQIKNDRNSKGNFGKYTNRNKNKRNFVKLYKKCKSMSSITNERSNTALNKINNLEEFFLALGSAKTLANVIDGGAERKILTAIKEMKNWIADITPRQALLVLLLANKKDTSNLVRYRPVILQGIAVNRITRASELDMEIEVIERENLNTFSKYEGISYLPALVENQDTLLEELYWIAKTTASDYQRNFDESSERLLRSLLEKRKKLNPSYLRVMARYVGLGLLKQTK